MPETALVTGGAGFIGSHLCELLLQNGYAVRALDNLSLGRREWMPREAQWIEGDIADPAVCRAACQGCSGVFHLAAMSRSAASLDNIEICTRNNIVGTQNVLAAAREAGVRKVVYSASSTCYGAQPPPHVEHMRPEFLNFYGLTKHAGEEYCLLFDRLYGLPCISLRYFNVYGPRQSGMGAYALVLSVFLEQWRRGQPLTIHGSGGQTRDFVHVRDVARANLLAFRSEARGMALNVGSGRGISIQSVADRISPAQAHLPAREGDSPATLAGISRISRVLGWRPEVRFEDGLGELMGPAPAAQALMAGAMR